MGSLFSEGLTNDVSLESTRVLERGDLFFQFFPFDTLRYDILYTIPSLLAFYEFYKYVSQSILSMSRSRFAVIVYMPTYPHRTILVRVPYDASADIAASQQQHSSSPVMYQY